MISGPSQYLYAALWSTATNQEVYRSTDQGVTWGFRGTPNPFAGGGEPSIAIQTDGMLLYVATWENLQNPKLYASADWGLTWGYRSDITALTGSSSGWEDVLDLAADAAGNLYALIWKESITPGYPEVYVSNDGGFTWTGPNTVDLLDWADPAGAIVEYGGNLYVSVWGDTPNCISTVYVSANGGVTWTQLSTLNVGYTGSTDNNFASLAALPSGNYYAAFWKDVADVMPRVHRSTDGGATWEYEGDIPSDFGGVYYERPTADILALYNPVSIGVGETAPPANLFGLRGAPGGVLFTTGAGGEARVTVFDAAGRKVTTLFAGKADRGQSLFLPLSLKPGVYFVRAGMGGASANLKKVLF